VLAPIARIAGPNLAVALPAIVLLNVLVLLPAAMLALYGIAARIGGRLFGYWVLLLWIVVPFIGIRYTNLGYHQKYTELLLPQSFGLTAMADFPAMVAVVVAAYFCTRDLFDERPRLLDAAAAGVAAGAAVAIKPSAAIFLLGPALAFAYRRRYSSIGVFVLGLTPAVLALALWKQRGIGHIPLFGSAMAPVPLASGAGGGATLGGLDLARYLNQLNWSHFADNLDLIREHFWSVRVIEWLMVGGFIGLLRRSPAALLLVGGWFAVFAIVKGSYGVASIEDGSLFRIMMPAFPAFILLLASVPLILPHVPARLRELRPAFRSSPRRTRTGLVAAAIVVSAVLPLGVFAAASTTGGSAAAASLAQAGMPVPTNVDLRLGARASGTDVVLRWKPQAASGRPVFYRVWRDRAGNGDGFTCAQPQIGGPSCRVSLPEVGVTREPVFEDRPGKGRWVYRVAVAANWLNDPTQGDVYLVSRPVVIAAR
jgi:hypothetical protein